MHTLLVSHDHAAIAVPSSPGMRAHVGSSRPGTGGSRKPRLSGGERSGSTYSMGSLASQDLQEYQDLGPFMDPSAVLQTVLRVLAVANLANRMSLDWQAQNEVRIQHAHAASLSKHESLHCCWHISIHLCCQICSNASSTGNQMRLTCLNHRAIC